MNNGPEKVFRNRICKELRAQNALVFPIIGGKIVGNNIYTQRENNIYTQNPGLPDIYVVHRYIGGIWLEFKAEKGKLSEKQRITIREMNARAAKTIAFIARSPGILENEFGDMFGSFRNGRELIQLIKEIQDAQV